LSSKILLIVEHREGGQESGHDRGQAARDREKSGAPDRESIAKMGRS
jgi:hypothetical protein